jgi:hypothetical protein
MLSAAVIVSVVSAWLAIVAGGIVWATNSGVGWPGALLGAALVNAALAGAIAYWVRGQVGELLFAATLRQLRHSADPAKMEPL